MLGIPQWKQPHSVLKVSPGSYFLMHRVSFVVFSTMYLSPFKRQTLMRV